MNDTGPQAPRRTPNGVPEPSNPDEIEFASIIPSFDDYVALRISVDWPLEDYEMGGSFLTHVWYGVSVRKCGELVSFGSVHFRHGAYFELYDLMTLVPWPALPGCQDPRARNLDPRHPFRVPFRA